MKEKNEDEQLENIIVTVAAHFSKDDTNDFKRKAH
jgi:hypothetical protein